jgi:hypothetical protein
MEVYPLVNVNKKLWKDPPFLMGKLTISMAIFNSYVTDYQRVDKVVSKWILISQFSLRSATPNS